MTLNEYLDGMRAARTADELDTAIQASHDHPFSGPIWSRICNVRIEVGLRIVDNHRLGHFVPRFDHRRNLTVAGESAKVGRGYNGAGVRWVWADAETFATGVLLRNGFSRRAAHEIWSNWRDYPHRCLGTIELARAGKLPDPPLNRLIFSHISTGPIRHTNKGTEDWEWRAERPCRCGGTRYDWGCGWNGFYNFISWHCDKCPRVYTEYVTNSRLSEIRSPRAAA